MIPDVSIIIRCFNEEKHISRLLTGIQEQTIDNVEIILVDSGSTDATISIASNFPVKLVQIKPEEFSFGYSLNKGCEAASGERLVFASAHVYPVFKDWLEKLIAPFEDPDVALCYGKQRGNEDTRYSEHQVFTKWFPDNSNLHQGHPFCNNANSAIRKELWQSCHFDEELTGLEDLDWARRQIHLGNKIAYVSDAEIIHVHEETASKIFNRYKREALAMRSIFPAEQFRLWDYIRLTSTNIVSDYYHAFHDKALLVNCIDIILFRTMQFSGTYAGFRKNTVLTGDMKHAFYYPRSLIREGDKINTQSNKIDYSHRKSSDE